MRPAGRFRYCFDPICIAAAMIYAVNRWYLKPHHIGGWFTVGYVNDLLCLPLFLPIILGLQRLVRVRRHDGFPRLWEMLQAWVIFSVLLEVILPRYPHYFRTTADPCDVVAYLVGGLVASGWWCGRALREGEAPAEPGFSTTHRLGGSLALPNAVISSWQGAGDPLLRRTSGKLFAGSWAMRKPVTKFILEVLVIAALAVVFARVVGQRWQDLVVPACVAVGVVAFGRFVEPWMDREAREAADRIKRRPPKGRGFPVKLVSPGETEPERQGDEAGANADRNG